MNWNKIKHAAWFIPLIVALTVAIITGAVFAAVNWQSANLHGTGTVTVTTTTTTPPVASFGGTITAASNVPPTGAVSIGTVASGATLNIGGVSATEYTLGITGVSATDIATGTYGFTLQKTPNDNTATLTAYFAAAMAGNPTYITDIGKEINGTAPFFFLNISGSTVNVYDGFEAQLGNATDPLVINDNYPVGTYTYTGTLTGANGASNLPVTVTLTVAEPYVWEIGSNIVTGNPSITLAFNSPTVVAGGAISATATLTVTNVGSTTINSWGLSNQVYPSTGSGWGLAVVATNTSLTKGNSTTLTFTLTGTAPSTSTTIDLSGVSCTLTPGN